MRTDPIEELIQSYPEVVARAIDRYSDRISRAFDEFMRNMPRLGCDGSLFSKYGMVCNEAPTVMLDEDFERTYNLSNMEIEFCEDCFRKFKKGEL